MYLPKRSDFEGYILSLIHIYEHGIEIDPRFGSFRRDSERSGKSHVWIGCDGRRPHLPLRSYQMCIRDRHTVDARRELPAIHFRREIMQVVIHGMEHEIESAFLRILFKTACFFFLQLPSFHSAERACKKTSSLTGFKR